MFQIEVDLSEVTLLAMIRMEFQHNIDNTNSENTIEAFMKSMQMSMEAIGKEIKESNKNLGRENQGLQE